MGRCIAIMLAALFVACSMALAAPVDLSVPFGNTDGCANRNGQEYYSDTMLLLTDTELVTSASACTFTEKTPRPDGSLAVKAMCSQEGESGEAAASFTIAPKQADASTLVVADEDGNLFGEVAACR